MRIGVVGLGLIGASWAGDLRRLGHEVIGISRQQDTVDRAVQGGWVDRAGLDLALLRETEVVFVCTPIALIVSTVARLAAVLPSRTIISDAGSVKGAIVAAATELWPNFVGAHPMAGKAESGLAAAELGMFRGRPLVITPIAATAPEAVAVVEAIARDLGCQIYQASPEDHDRAVAWISHLPVMVSASLIHSCLTGDDPELLSLAQALASSGFRDTSRVGGGNPELGRMMAEYNRAALLQTLHSYQQDLQNTIAAIEDSDWEALGAKLDRNYRSRPQFL